MNDAQGCVVFCFVVEISFTVDSLIHLPDYHYILHGDFTGTEPMVYIPQLVDYPSSNKIILKDM